MTLHNNYYRNRIPKMNNPCPCATTRTVNTPDTERVTLWIRQGQSATFDVDALEPQRIKIARISSDDCRSDRAKVTTTEPHCISTGEVFRFLDIREPCPQIDDLCVTIIDIIDECNFYIPYEVPQTILGGQLAKVIDLSDALSFDGQIRPKQYGTNGYPPIPISIRQGSVVAASPYMPNFPFKDGDVIDIPKLGIEKVRVHNLYRVENILKFHIDTIPTKSGCELATINCGLVAPIITVTTENCHLFGFNQKFNGNCGRIQMGIRLDDLNCIPINWARPVGPKDQLWYGGYEYCIVAKWSDRQLILDEGDLFIKPSVYR
jgi:hypothetical protein